MLEGSSGEGAAPPAPRECAEVSFRISLVREIDGSKEGWLGVYARSKVGTDRRVLAVASPDCAAGQCREHSPTPPSAPATASAAIAVPPEAPALRCRHRYGARLAECPPGALRIGVIGLLREVIAQCWDLPATVERWREVIWICHRSWRRTLLDHSAGR